MKNLSNTEINAIQAAISLSGLNEAHKTVLLAMIKKPNEDHGTADLYVDGASDLHSKTAGIGGVIYSNGIEIFSFAIPLIDKTNNEAEYMAMIKGIQDALTLNIQDLRIFSDSELVVKQINGEYKVKNDRMKKLHTLVFSELQNMGKWVVTHVRREKNTRADELSKIGMMEARKNK
ncbi:MAG: ribonuclease HI family protein [Candidatus Marinimicrobia bacterium]|jgi:ribonuclease HI|nr:ribonuclease HI family protein [Candidatus Neomarinimicrobiota bacterium]MBT3502328.1 ribonuclease HI family protein [Candidatus Neomarinimicrobiota bacterium]MBT3840390.1 ribonuclease HI family protein [Candidatus Neomarinimicrobiota bacterium]MBT3999455.1 ribonuclease HI family protein [Candidatus Neomarinimicrobiota bacterium]MBT4282048.1 ribonuclease HI family protein [Candidatus Neomarinimicrobiota bacterium]